MQKSMIVRWVMSVCLLVLVSGCSSAGEATSIPGNEPPFAVTAPVNDPGAYPEPQAQPGQAATAYPNPPMQTDEPQPDTPVDSQPSPYPQASEPAPAVNQSWAPQPGDAAYQRGEAFIEKKDVLVMESMPPQFRLGLAGTLPTPCHELRVAVQPPDEENQINIEVYSVADPSRMCTQVLEPFLAEVPLENLEGGQYTVMVNGEQAGEGDVP